MQRILLCLVNLANSEHQVSFVTINTEMDILTTETLKPSKSHVDIMCINFAIDLLQTLGMILSK